VRFSGLYDRARKRQAELIAQSCLDLDPQDKDKAIADRLRFDVRKRYVGKISPTLYGERQAEVNVAQVQAVITPAKLEELRAGLEETREALRDKAP